MANMHPWFLPFLHWDLLATLPPSGSRALLPCLCDPQELGPQPLQLPPYHPYLHGSQTTFKNTGQILSLLCSQNVVSLPIKSKVVATAYGALNNLILLTQYFLMPGPHCLPASAWVPAAQHTCPSDPHGHSSHPSPPNPLLLWGAPPQRPPKVVAMTNAPSCLFISFKQLLQSEYLPYFLKYYFSL